MLSLSSCALYFISLYLLMATHSPLHLVGSIQQSHYLVIPLMNWTLKYSFSLPHTCISMIFHLGEHIQVWGVICLGKALWKPVSFFHLLPPNPAEMGRTQLHMSQWLNTRKLSNWAQNLSLNYTHKPGPPIAMLSDQGRTWTQTKYMVLQADSVWVSLHSRGGQLIQNPQCHNMILCSSG